MDEIYMGYCNHCKNKKTKICIHCEQELPTEYEKDIDGFTI